MGENWHKWANNTIIWEVMPISAHFYPKNCKMVIGKVEVALLLPAIKFISGSTVSVRFSVSDHYRSCFCEEKRPRQACFGFPLSARLIW